MRLLVAVLCTAFLISCSQVQKPEALDITEPNLLRCKVPALVFDTYRLEVEERNPGIIVTVLVESEAMIFLSAFNKSEPVTTFSGDTIALFNLPGAGETLVSIIKNDCVQMAKGFPPFMTALWSMGVPTGLTPSSFPRDLDSLKGFSI